MFRSERLHREISYTTCTSNRQKNWKYFSVILVYMIFCKGIFSIKYFNAINHQHSTLSNDKKEIHTSWNMMEISTQIHCDTCWHNCSKSLFLLTGFDLSPTVWRRHHLTVSWMPIELRLIFQSLIVQSDKWHITLQMMYDFSH